MLCKYPCKHEIRIIAADSYRMKNIIRLFIVAQNLAIPYMIGIVLVFILFFVYGSGAVGQETYNNHKLWWMAAYAASGLIHLLLFFKYIKFLQQYLKIIIAVVITAFYIYQLFLF